MDDNTKTLATFIATAVITISVVAVTVKWANDQYWQTRPANDVILVEQAHPSPTVASNETP